MPDSIRAYSNDVLSAELSTVYLSPALVRLAMVARRTREVCPIAKLLSRLPASEVGSHCAASCVENSGPRMAEAEPWDLKTAKVL